MKFARFEHNGKVYNGLAEADEIAVIRGSFIDLFEMTEQTVPVSEVRFLPPILPTKIVCVFLFKSIVL